MGIDGIEHLKGDDLKTPEEWCKEFKIHILDPDGWRYDNKDFNDPVTREDFERRMIRSTIRRNNATD